jgi:hypothetical protein
MMNDLGWELWEAVKAELDPILDHDQHHSTKLPMMRSLSYRSFEGWDPIHSNKNHHNIIVSAAAEPQLFDELTLT